MSKPIPTTVVQLGGSPPALAPDADAPAFRASTEPGDLGRLAGYRVLKLLGRGGMGAVYLALDEGLRRQVALKVMLPRYAANTESSERFRREARAAAAVRHDNVVTVYQVGEDYGTPFLAMEFLSGYPLDEYLKRKGRLTVAQALRVGAETAAGLAAAHAMGLIHRDIKPANLWLEAPQGRIKILDFGLAKPVATGGEQAELTGVGVVMGTPAYMAPEQAKGEPVDHRADLFSLGVVLYQLTTGQRPFDRASAVASLIALTTEAAAPVRSLNPAVPEALATVIHGLLAKDPAERLSGAAEVAKQFRALERGEHAPEARELTAVPTAAPQVVYVPIHVTAYEPINAEFAHLGDSSAASTAPVAAEHTEKKLLAPQRDARFPVWAVALALALLVGGIGGIIYALREPTEVAKQPPPNLKPEEKPKPPAPVPTPKTPDPTRLFAEWVLAKGGSVETSDGSKFTDPAKLPAGPLRITGMSLVGTGYRPTNADVERFRACPELKHLECSDMDLTDDGFVALAALPQAGRLERLGVRSPKATIAGVAHLAKCRGLIHLNLSRTPLTGGLKFVSELPELQYFIADDAKLTNADLAVFRGTRLKSLNVNENREITEAALEPLVGQVQLTSLGISRTGVTGTGAGVIAKFTKLVYLRAEGLGWTDDDLPPLRALTTLNEIQLAGNPITDAGLDVVRDLPSLTRLGVSNTGITDTGIEKLAAKNKLIQLNLSGTKVTLPGVNKLKAALPNCKVVSDFDKP